MDAKEAMTWRSLTKPLTLRKNRKWSNIKCLLEVTKGRKRGEDKIRNKEQGPQIEHTNEYDRY